MLCVVLPELRLKLGSARGGGACPRGRWLHATLFSSQFIVMRIGQHSQFGSGSFHFVEEGVLVPPNMEKSLRSLPVGDGAPFMLNITILIALMPFLEGGGERIPYSAEHKDV